MNEQLKSRRIGVLMGGLSTEREVSLHSGEAVLNAMKTLGYQAIPIFVDHDIDRVLRESRVDLVFNALHGQYGEDGCMQGMLELMGIPYTGSGVLASALAMNKVKAKEIFRLHNLPTPPYYTVEKHQIDQLEELHGSFGLPVIVKPATQGSSIGVVLVSSFAELKEACSNALALSRIALVERYIPGKEVHVGILNNKPLGAIGIVSHNQLFDYQAKYSAGHAHFQLPAKLSAERYRGVLTQALRAHQALGCSGATRVNMIVSDLGNEYILEVNTLPGLTSRSLLPRIAKHAGMGYPELVEAILSDVRLNESPLSLRDVPESSVPTPFGDDTDILDAPLLA